MTCNTYVYWVTWHKNGMYYPFGLAISKSVVLKISDFKMCVLKILFLKSQLNVL